MGVNSFARLTDFNLQKLDVTIDCGSRAIYSKIQNETANFSDIYVASRMLCGHTMMKLDRSELKDSDLKNWKGNEFHIVGMEKKMNKCPVGITEQLIV